MPPIYDVFLADDRAQVREGLKLALAKSPEFRIAGEVGDGPGLLKLLRETGAPDAVILDISMPGMRGIQVIREVRKLDLNVRVLVLTMHKEEDVLCQALLAGADGVLLKEELTKDLVPGLETVLRGEVYVSPCVIREVEDSWLKMFIASREDPVQMGLSLQETEVLRLLAEGGSNAEIAARLQISRLSVSRHRARLMEKLRIKRTADLVKYAVRKGYAS